MLGSGILGSVAVNIYSLTLNKYQYTLLNQLAAPASELEVPGDMGPWATGAFGS